MTAKNATQNLAALVKAKKWFSKNDAEKIEALEGKDKFTNEEKKTIASLRLRTPSPGISKPLESEYDW